MTWLLALWMLGGGALTIYAWSRDYDIAATDFALLMFASIFTGPIIGLYILAISLEDERRRSNKPKPAPLLKARWWERRK